MINEYLICFLVLHDHVLGGVLPEADRAVADGIPEGPLEPVRRLHRGHQSVRDGLRRREGRPLCAPLLPTRMQSARYAR